MEKKPGLKVSLVPGAKNAGTRAHFGRGSKVCSLLVDIAYVIILASISPDDTVLGQGRALILRGREHGLPRPLPLSLVESKLLLDVRYHSVENMLAKMNMVRKFN